MNRSPAPEVRRAAADDISSMIDVAVASLGWDPADPNESLFRWKHLDNPAGQSAMWVATESDGVVGFRTMLRWRFTLGTAVRAVDTATHPSHHRRGVFRSLTMQAVDELADEGVGFVFNTPNDNSRPGYLRMGWQEAGRLPVRFSARGIGSLSRLVRARTAAEKWSLPLDAGAPIDSVAADLTRTGTAGGREGAFTTVRDVDYLCWRYGFDALRYRVIQTDAAAAVVRLRRRGPATEAVIADVFSPSRRETRRLFHEVLRLPGADYLLTLANPPHHAPRLPTVPGLGPHLTLRDLSAPAPSSDRLQFSLGDIELF